MATLDYLAGTYQRREVEEVLSDFAGICSGWNREKGHHGYQSSWVSGGVRVYYDGREGMGVHVQASGEGCSEILASGRYENEQRWCSDWIGRGCKFSRVDLAVDDKSGRSSVELFERALLDGCVVSKWVNYEGHYSCKAGTPSGRTVYLGERVSDAYLCVYDKRRERIAAGCFDPGVWTRYELRYKSSQACAAGLKVATSDDLSFVGQLLAGACDVKVANEAETNKSRWKTEVWWREVCAGASRGSLYVHKQLRSLAEQVAEFEWQAGKRLAILSEAAAEVELNEFLVDDILARARRRLCEKDRNKIHALVERSRL